jgi:hypothetical protein
MAGMYLTWGGYTHAGSEVYYTRTRRPKYSRIGKREGYKEVWSIKGDLVDSSAAGLIPKIAALEAAYKDHGRDLTFRYEDGTATQDALISSATLNGTRVLDFSWLSGVTLAQGHFGSKTQHVYTRAYQIVVSGDILDSEINVVFFTHSIRLLGLGGFDYVVQESLAGPPITQITKLQTGFGAMQTGIAIGLLTYPSPAALMFGNPLPKLSSVEYSAPLVFGANWNTYFKTEWRFVYAGVNAFSGLPTGF